MDNEFKAIEEKIESLIKHAWDDEIKMSQVRSWLDNFTGGAISDKLTEQKYMAFGLSKFIYFSKQMVKAMLASLFNDHFKTVIIQEIRRSNLNTHDTRFLAHSFINSLKRTNFISMGNPAESGAHLLYYFRQVNELPKNIFKDFHACFNNDVQQSLPVYVSRNSDIERYIFFDDLVGSGDQASEYLEDSLEKIRRNNSALDLRFMCLFATTSGLKKLNDKKLFDGKAVCLFELDDSYEVEQSNCRYFHKSPDWFSQNTFITIAKHYARTMNMGERDLLGYKNGQQMIGFSHNTPDNSLPIFWFHRRDSSWNPIFIRYSKVAFKRNI